MRVLIVLFFTLISITNVATAMGISDKAKGEVAVERKIYEFEYEEGNESESVIPDEEAVPEEEIEYLEGSALTEDYVKNEIDESPDNCKTELETVYFDKSLFEPKKKNKVFELRIENFEEYITSYPDFTTIPNYEYKVMNFWNTKSARPYMQSSLPMEINVEIGANAKVYVGQVFLSDFENVTLKFMRERETYYNEGAKITVSGQLFDYSVGFFNSTLNNDVSAGSIISTKPLDLKNFGAVTLGGAHYIYDINNDMVNTLGLFSSYKNKKFILNTQFANSRKLLDNTYENKFYLMPELLLTNSLSLKLILQQNLTDLSTQKGFGIKYKPFKNSNKFEVELNTTTKYSDSLEPSQRLNFSTKFKI